MKNILKQLCLWTLILTMVLSGPMSAFAEVKVNHKDIAGDKAKFINERTPVQIARPGEGETAADLVKDPVLPAIYTLRTDYKAEKGEKYSVNYQPYVASVGAAATEDEQKKVNKKIDLPNMAGYKMPEGVKSFTNSYKDIVDAAKDGHKTTDNGDKYLALREYKYTAIQNNIKVKHVFQNMEDFNKFTNKDGTITKNDGTVVDKDGTETKYDLKDPAQKEKYQEFVRDHETIRILSGNTGSTLEVQPLQEDERPGFEPQVKKLKTQVPEDTSEFKIEYRYNRAAYDVVFDTQDGTPLPTRTYYYDQEIPKIDENSIPTKIGCEFLGWKPSRDLEGMLDGKKHTFNKGEIITDANGHAVVDLGNIYYKRNSDNTLVLNNGDPVKGTNATDIQLKVPAMKLGDGKSIPREKLTFTAVWKDKDKADYAIQFWVEKADHPENASILNKYDYMGTRVYEQKPTGTRPDLATEPVKGLNFPDLNKTRLQKIWNGAKFNRGHDLYLNKFFVYNKELTDEQNKDLKNPTMTKAVSATGETVYNIYYDRQVYDLYFTKSNVQPEKNTIYPEIWGYDPAKGESVMLGGPGKPYHYKARFNEMMYKWPNDAKQTKGFTPGYQSFGWGPNYTSPNWPVHLDTPPYRLNADEFLDMANYTTWGGYVKHIDKGDNTTIDLDPLDFRTLSFGIKQDHPSIPHHMDFWMDGFKDGETIIRYDLVRTKADTAGLDYGHRYPIVTGFTPYGYDPKKQWPFIQEGSQEDGRVDEDRIGDLNDEREDITPNTCGNYYNNNGIKLPIGQLDFIPVFYSDADPWGDVKDGGQSFEQNGYLQFHYKRNKYPLRFNTDPTKIKDDSEFTYPVKSGKEFTNEKANALETFYEFPLKVLSPDLVDGRLDREKREYFKEDPKNCLDNPDNLYKLGLYDLLQRDKTDPKKFAKDKDGHYRVKRPEGLSDQMVFKGWATDPAGKKMVWKNKDEKMPFHPMNLYAIWDEPDYKWKVTVDPNGGTLGAIDPGSLTTEMKTIKEGDIGREEENTYPVVGYEGKDLPTKDENKPQVFTVVQKQKLKKLPTPKRYGYDFLGWEVVRYKKAPGGDYTNEQDNSYREKYKVPELYSFGTDVVSPIYLKAIWVENKRARVKVLHYYLKNEKTENGEKLVLDTSKYPNPDPNDLAFKRVGDYVPATGEKQDEHWILADHGELMEKLSGKWEEQIKDSKGKVTGTKEHDLKPEYEKYNERVKLNNTFFQSFRVQDNINVGTEDNPVYKPNPENIFRFYYRPFRTRNYKVNYIDERGKVEINKFLKGLDLTDTTGLTGDALLAANTANNAKFEKKEEGKEKTNRELLNEILDKYKVIDKEAVVSQCRHYDARNYRPIPGWTLASSAQQQLFYDVNENTNEFLGINGTGSDEIYFYYKDARVIEVKNPKDPVPDGYVRVTFKIDDVHKGGVFKDKDGKEVTELHYDVIKGLKSNNLPHPIIWKDGKDDQGNDKVKEANRYYITPDQGKTFKEWDNEKWLNKETLINRDYTFTAYFDWSGMSTKSTGLVRTEAYTDPNGKWTNDFAPKLSDLKAQLVWKEGDQVKPIPSDVTITFVDGKGNELTTDDDVFNLVKEKNLDDAKETVRTERIDAIVTFKKDQAEITKLKGELRTLAEGLKALESADPKDKNAIAEQAKKIEDKKKELGQVLDVSIKVYKNRYEALNKNWEKPIYLSDAEGKEAKDGGLKDVTGNYVKVTVSPTGDMEAKDNKVYYVNPKAWVEIPEVKADGSSTFINWTADKTDQNEDKQANGKFDFAKRHKFTEDTVITPVGAGDVVEQEKGKDKPDVPKSYVKVIVKTTDKATDETAFEKIFWVNPKADVTIPVTNPTGKTVAADPAKPGTVGYTMNFFKWQTEDKSKAWEGKIAGKFEKDTTILAQYSVEFEKIKDLTPKTDTVPTPQGKTPTVDEIKEKITPPEGKTIKEVKIVKDPDVSKPGESKVQVIVEYTDGSSVGTNDNPIEVPVEVHKNIIPEAPGGQRPKDALDNYVKVIFKAGTGGSVSGDLVYYVSPEVEVDMTDPAGKITKTPSVGYTANGGTWSPEIKAEKIENEKTYEFNFVKSKDIVEKIDENTKIPEGYVTVTFKTEDEAKGKVDGKDKKVYYVNPKAGITLKVLGKGETATDKQLAVPTYAANTNYTFVAWQEAIDEKTPITSDRIHVATFQFGKFTLTYDKGGEDVTGNVPKPVTVNFGETVGLADKGTLKKPNHEFVGWKLDKDETLYQPGAQVKLEKARTATAQWKLVKHTVMFDLAKGTIDNKTVKDPVQVDHGSTVGTVTEPVREGYVFTGWKFGKTSFDPATTPVNSDVTLVAQWEKAVQPIGENDTVDENHFIKVTFKQGDHGQLVPDKDKQDVKKDIVTYKVAKADTFDQAVKHGLVVPGIAPNKYYKVAEDQPGVPAKYGWDQPLDLTLKTGETEKVFIAQYELVANVIPVDPNQDDEILKQEKPDDMVLVVFKVPEDKAFMTGETKFYVKRSELVNIKAPVVHPLTLDNGQVNDYEFKGWSLVTNDSTKQVSFTDDTTIIDSQAEKPDIRIRNPRPNAKMIFIQELTADAKGYLEVIRDGKTTIIEASPRGKKFVFKLSSLEGGCVKANDLIKFHAEKGGIKSDVREYRVK